LFKDRAGPGSGSPHLKLRSIISKELVSSSNPDQTMAKVSMPMESCHCSQSHHRFQREPDPVSNDATYLELSTILTYGILEAASLLLSVLQVRRLHELGLNVYAYPQPRTAIDLLSKSPQTIAEAFGVQVMSTIQLASFKCIRSVADSSQRVPRT
jgi:hypothetical protein